MVATLVQLRLRILLNTVKKDTWRLVFMIIGLVYAGFIVIAIAAGAWALARSGIDLTTAFIAFGVVLTLAWVIVPLLSFGLDDTLDPVRFAQFTAPTLPFAIGLVIAGAITIPGILTLGVLGALTLAWVGSPSAIPVWILAAAIGLLTCLALARVTTTAAATFLRSRRGKDITAMAGLVFLIAFVFVMNSFDPDAVSDIWESTQPGLAVLAWTPLGAAWAIPGAVAEGQYGLAALYLVVALAWLALIGYAWLRLLTPAMTSVTHARVATQRGEGRGRLPHTLHEQLRLPTPAAAVAARALRYWRTDPRYLMQAVVIFIVPPLLAVAIMVAPNFPNLAILGLPIVAAFFGGWALHNDTAYDSTALWMFIASGGPGRHDRLGRLVGYIIWALPALLLITVAAVIVRDAWDIAPALFGVVLAIFGGGVGFSLGLSAAVAYPVQPPGVSPFSTTGTGAMGYTVLVQSVAVLATIVLAIPTLIFGLLAYFGDPTWGWVALVLGIATMVGGPWLGIRVGGDLLDQRGPVLLNKISGWEGH